MTNPKSKRGGARAGAGAKPKGERALGYQLAVRLAAEAQPELERRAAEQGVKAADVVRDILHRALGIES